MNKILAAIREFLTPIKPLPAGTYHSQSETTRLHLRIENDGQGLLIINAATVLHLNQTATEYAYHFIEGKTPQEAGLAISQRYSITNQQAQKDYQELIERIETLITTPDLDPVTFLEFERESPYAGAMSAPYRLDCALTYHLPDGSAPTLAPTRRVDRELSTEEWKTIIDKASQAGIPHLIFTGGEPTLREDLAELITHAEKNNQVTGLLTDGLRLAEKAYLDELLQSGLDHLLITFTPNNEEVWQALQLILPEDLFTTVHLTITPDIADEIPNTLTRLAEMGTNAISLSVTKKDNWNMNEALEEAQNHTAELGLPLKWDLPVPYSAHNPVALELEEAEKHQLPQGAGKAWLYVEPDGDVLPTQGINQVLGNLLRQPWQEIWDEVR
ncbi:MAG: hypothetical protein DRI56_01785 [Chloroflexota bacterium]|nr:MAG: hypothetical protein DRI56_01785 [Chloroflexota bacterium]